MKAVAALPVQSAFYCSTTLVFKLGLHLYMSTPHPASGGMRYAADAAASQIPNNFQLRLTEAASQYINSRWRVELSSLKRNTNDEMKANEKPPSIEVSEIIPDKMLEELRSVAVSLAEVSLTTCKKDMLFI